MEDRFRIKCAVYLIVLNDKKVLCGIRKNSGWRDGYYTLPAGHIMEGEGAIEACLRESKEEAGLELQVEDIKFAHLHMQKGDKDRGDEYFDVYFITENYTGPVVNLEPDKNEGFVWLDINNLPENVVPTVKIALSHFIRNKPYSEDGF